MPAMSPGAASWTKLRCRLKRAAFCDWFAFGLPPGEQILGYPIAGANEAFAHGLRRFNIVWCRAAAEGGTLRELLTDTSGVQHELSIPPDVIHPKVMARMRVDAERLLPPHFAEVLRHIRRRGSSAFAEDDGATGTALPHSACGVASRTNPPPDPRTDPPPGRGSA
jgi:hypothetical protein